MNNQYKILDFVIVTIIIHSIQAQVTLHEFYPYGSEHGDISLNPANKDDGSSNPITLTQGFRYFNATHETIWVNVNGAVSFKQAIRTFTPTCKSLPSEFSMIAPFWADVDLTYGGDIFYRETVEMSVRRKASHDIAMAFSEFTDVEVKWAFIVTWLNVSYYGARNCDIKSRNTFQSVLASDGVHSFAIFNYNDINWTTGTASHGVCPGVGGLPAKCGFDSGDGSSFYNIPGSCTGDIINVNNRSNVDQKGKWVFRVDNENIRPAGCSDSFNSLLRVEPYFVDLLGHMPLRLSGPCLNGSAEFTCRFHDKDKGIIDMPGIAQGLPTEHSIICMVPFLYKCGRIKIELIIKNDESREIYQGYLYLVEPKTNDKRVGVAVTRVSSSVVNVNFTWNPAYFDKSSTVGIYLYAPDVVDGKWVRSLIFAENIVNSGSYFDNFNEQDFPEDANSATIVFIEPITDSDSGINRIERGRWNKLMSMLVNFGKEFFEVPNIDPCFLWYLSDSGVPDDLLHCPCNVTQLRVDPRFKTDPACKSPPCKFHEGVDFCTRPIEPSPSHAGQQCCYKNGILDISLRGGGTVDKRHYEDYVGHFSNDVVPWLMCCQYRSDESCARYRQKRPSDDCSKYEPPQPSGARGDPHITTFDGLDYTFNGAGEFWLIRDGPGMPVSVQSRMEPFVSSDGEAKNATVFTAFTMKSVDTSLIQVQKSSMNKFDLYVDNVKVNLSDPALYDTTYDGVTVMVSDDMNQISISFSSGFNFIISTNTDALSIMIMCDKRYIGKTRGLLGNYDGNKDNDLQDQHGNVINTEASTRDIHYQFGLKWRVLLSESLFKYSAKQYNDYNIKDFEPSFTEPDLTNVPEQAQLICDESIECIYDYMTTGSVSVANHTKYVRDEFNEIVRIYESKVISCQELRYPTNGYYKADNYLPGSFVNFVCFENYMLNGAMILYCQNNGTWNDTAPICVQNNDDITTTTPRHTTPTTSDPNNNDNNDDDDTNKNDEGDDSENRIFWYIGFGIIGMVLLGTSIIIYAFCCSRRK